MSKQHSSPVQLDTAIRRAAGYDLLARAFAYPDENSFQGVCEVAAAAGHLLAGGPLHQLLESLASSSASQLEPAYIACFTLTTSADCPTYETAYLCPDPQQQPSRMADINGFYRAFAADAADTTFRPDDISVELEFMSFLCRKQAYALEHLGAARAGQAVRAQRLFLERHLGRWAAALGGRTAGRASNDFYRTLGRALADWLAAEELEVGALVEDRVEAPQLPWPDRAERGGASGALPVVLGDEIPLVR